MGWLAVLIGAILIPMTFFSLDRSGWLNAVAGVLSIGIGIAVLKAVSRYEQKHLPHNQPPSE